MYKYVKVAGLSISSYGSPLPCFILLDSEVLPLEMLHLNYGPVLYRRFPILLSRRSSPPPTTAKVTTSIAELRPN